MSRKHERRRPAAAEAVPSGRTAAAPWLARYVERFPKSTFAILLLAGSIRIVATYPVFNHTVDEPAHIACGMEWLDKGVYRYEPQHPPLARVAAALGPYLAGRRYTGRPSIFNEGAAILYGDGHYDRNLTLARLGVLPFFWIASLVVWIWGRKNYGELAGAAAAGLFTFLPPVLAHGGLATTDMALTAFVSAALLSAISWAEHPSLGRAGWFGITTGLAVLSKLSALAFLPAALAAALIWYGATERPGLMRVGRMALRRLPSFCLAVAIGFLVIWAGYRFSYGKVSFTGLRLPAPELYAGIESVSEHNAQGHPSYLLGSRSNVGWWQYYPIVLSVKTPLAFLALVAFGVMAARRRPLAANRNFWIPLVPALGILIFALFSHINIGIRHILPVYVGLSLAAGAGVIYLFERGRTAPWARWTLGLLLAWMAASSLLAHPDYLPYFNALAGDEPEKIVVDSDLDWGQDMKRLAARLREVGAREVAFNPFIVAYLAQAHGFPRIVPMDPVNPSPGWNAASLTVLKVARLGLYDQYPGVRLWADRIKPMERVGKSVYLWYFPPRQAPAGR